MSTWSDSIQPRTSNENFASDPVTHRDRAAATHACSWWFCPVPFRARRCSTRPLRSPGTSGETPIFSVLWRILVVTLTKWIRQNSSKFRSQTFDGPFSSASKPIFATKYALERAWRDLQLPHYSRDRNLKFRKFSDIFVENFVQDFVIFCDELVFVNILVTSVSGGNGGCCSK